MNTITVQVPKKKDTAFVIMPFSDEFDELKLLINDAANQAGLPEYRADTNPTPVISIRDGIIQEIRAAKIVVAICSPETGTGCINSNVVYELGYAHSIGKGTLMLTTTIDSIPFNPQDNNNVLLYDPKKIETDRKGLVLEIKDKMKGILDRVGNGLTDSGYTDITGVEESMPSKDRLYFVYFDLIRYAKRVHHLFQKLDQEGCHKIDTAARTLFLTQSEGNQPGLISDCQDGWYKCKDSRDEIQKNLIKDQADLECRVIEAFNELKDNTRHDLAAYMIDNSLKSFDKIKVSLETYKTQIPIISRHFDGDGILIIDTIKGFEQSAWYI